MRLDNFCCPVCKKPLAVTTAKLCCVHCERDFASVDGIPDLFVGDVEPDFVDDPNRAWLDPRIVEARDTVYRLCSRELKGMIFCMQEIDRRVRAGCRILEVGMGTGHFTRWLAEVSGPGTEIYALDFSWPIIEKAKANTQGLSGITLFRANARRSLPFTDASFDIVLQRLAPLGGRGIPSAQASFELLKPGRWYFQAGWKPEQYETPPTEWAISNMVTKMRSITCGNIAVCRQNKSTSPCRSSKNIWPFWDARLRKKLRRAVPGIGQAKVEAFQK